MKFGLYLPPLLLHSFYMNKCHYLTSFPPQITSTRTLHRTPTHSPPPPSLLPHAHTVHFPHPNPPSLPSSILIQTNATMDLVLFEDAMKHIARIVRVVMNSGGHALLGE